MNGPGCPAGQRCGHGKFQIEKWRQGAADDTLDSAMKTAAEVVALTRLAILR